MSSDPKQIEARLKKLETDYDREVNKMLQVLEKIQQRLVGSLEDRSAPGLIAEVRELQNELEQVKRKLGELRAEFEQLKTSYLDAAVITRDLTEMKQQLPALWKKVRMYDRYRWIIIGGVLVIGYLFSKVWEFFMRKPIDIR
jgi:ABC-type phosphate transport system auxiliary subunit